MPPLVIPNTVRVNLVWSLSGTEYAVNVLHYIVPAPVVVTGATAADLGSDITTAFTSSTLDDYIDASVSLTRVSVRDIRAASQPEYSATVAAPGLASGDILPLQISLVATFRTALAGRSYRGRYYQPGWAENANESTGTAAQLAADALETFLFAIDTPTVQGNGWALGVMSTTLGETNAVTDIEVRDLVWDTQRRRAYPGI